MSPWLAVIPAIVIVLALGWHFIIKPFIGRSDTLPSQEIDHE